MRPVRRLSRRTMLRGLGAAIALPCLDAMSSRSSSAGAASPPARMAFLYVPNGVHMPDWTPSVEGAHFELPPILQPLRSLEQDLLVLSGLTLDKARSHGDGGGDHARAMATFLTGKHPRKTDGTDLRAGISVDQVAAQSVGRQTRFASLEIGCEGSKNAGECDHGYSCAYQSNLSWKNETSPLAKQTNPRLVFDRLFGSPTASASEAARARAERQRKSILDFVADDTKRVQDRLGVTDRRKLDEYLTGLREVERRIDRPPVPVNGGSAQAARPLGIPADYEEHLRLMADLVVLAFQGDVTRVVTLVFANDGSNRSYPAIDVPDGHHDLSHHGGDEAKAAKIRRINQFHVSQLAYLLHKLKAVKEGESHLLDQCMILYGSGISDGNRHTHDDLPIVLAGGAALSLKHGRHIRYERETPLTNLYLAMLDRVGAGVDAFGDSRGRLHSLDG
jgi:hypothetical protein